jgi:hypothetical protein
MGREKDNNNSFEDQKRDAFKAEMQPYDGTHDGNSTEDRTIRGLSKIPKIDRIIKSMVGGAMIFDIIYQGIIDLTKRNVYDNLNNRSDEKHKVGKKYQQDKNEQERLKYLIKHKLTGKSQRKKLKKSLNAVTKEINHYEKNRDKIQSLTKEKGIAETEKDLFNKRLEYLKKRGQIEPWNAMLSSRAMESGKKFQKSKAIKYVKNKYDKEKDVERNAETVSDKVKKKMVLLKKRQKEKFTQDSRDSVGVIATKKLERGSIEYIDEQMKLNNKQIESFSTLRDFAKDNNWMEEERNHQKSMVKHQELNGTLKEERDNKLQERKGSYTFTEGGDKKLGYSTKESLDIANQELNQGLIDHDTLKRDMKEAKTNDEKKIISKKQAVNQQEVKKWAGEKKSLESKLEQEKSGTGATSSTTTPSTSTASAATSASHASATPAASSADSGPSKSAVSAAPSTSTASVATSASHASATPAASSADSGPSKSAVSAAPSGSGKTDAKCCCCEEIKKIRAFLANSQIADSEKTTVGNKLDEIQTRHDVKDHSKVYAAGGNAGISSIEQSESETTDFTIPVEKIKKYKILEKMARQNISVNGGFKPNMMIPKNSNGEWMEQDMIFREDGDYSNFTRGPGKKKFGFDQDVAKRHFPGSLKGAKSEIKDAFRRKLEQPLNIDQPEFAVDRALDFRAQMTSVKDVPNVSSNLERFSNDMLQKIKHIDYILNGRLPGGSDMF